MPRKNKNRNKSYNFHPQNVPYYPNHNNYNMYHQQYPNNDDDYNYNTSGRFQKRFNNQTEYQNRQFTNENYRYRTFNNTQYTNWRYPDQYVNTYTNENHFNREHTNRDYNIEHTQAKRTNNQLTNAENILYAENGNAYEISSDTDYGMFRAETTGNKVDNYLPEINKIDNLPEINKTDNFPEINKIDNLPEINKIDNLSEINMIRPSTRTIQKKCLKEKTELPQQVKKQKINSSYTDNFWKKGKESDEPDQCEETEKPCNVFHLKNKQKKKKQPTTNQSQFKKANKFEKKVNQMLSAPVEMSKGRSLLEKMGWKGGGLGKDGDGIVEPIAPKAIYATATMGLGQLTEEDVEEPGLIDQVYYKTLTYILEFVKNYLECELKFESSLSRFERKRIHKTVEELRNGVEDGIPHPYKSIVQEIYHYNDYLLVTESTGKKKSRHLILYKEAHEHMFLLTPEDLEEEEEEITDDKDIPGSEQTKTVNENIKIGETNNIENQVNNEIDKKIHNDTGNKETDSKKEETNKVENQVNSQIDNEIDNDTGNKETNSKKEETNKVENQVNSQIDIETNKNTGNKEIGSKKEEANNVEKQINSQIAKEVNNDTGNKEINSNREANNIENQVNSQIVKEIKSDIGNKKSKDITGNKKHKQEEKKKDKSKDINDILDIIINYFMEYTEDPLYTEFRLLGPFDYKERCAIDMFFEVCKKVRTIERSEEILQMFDCDDYYLELRLDNNGRYVIHKIEKNKEDTAIQNV